MARHRDGSRPGGSRGDLGLNPKTTQEGPHLFGPAPNFVLVFGRTKFGGRKKERERHGCTVRGSVVRSKLPGTIFFGQRECQGKNTIRGTNDVSYTQV